MEAEQKETATTAAVAAAASQNIDVIAKGKRTKRQRPNSPVSFAITPPAPYNAATTAVAAHSPRSPTSSEESITTEEVDTARCLILLSRGPTYPSHNYHHNNNNNRRSDAATTYCDVDGACMYTCKTCNRSFRSFQALGGHRASHTKPRNEKKSAFLSDEEDFPSPSSSKNRFSPSYLSLHLNSASAAAAAGNFSAALPSPRIHECSYCGAEFSSGQALGGHMRKHRGAGPISRSSPNIPEEIAINDEVELEQRKRKARNWLSLDLNLPAPDDEREKSPGPNRICPPLINWHD